MYLDYQDLFDNRDNLEGNIDIFVIAQASKKVGIRMYCTM